MSPHVVSAAVDAPFPARVFETRGAMGLCALVLFLQAALLTSTAWDKSDTTDEPDYLIGALAQWTQGDYTNNCHAPAIPRWGFGLGLRVSDPALFSEWRESDGASSHPLYSRPRLQMRQNLFAARAATILVTVLAGLFLHGAAEMLWPGAGLLAQILWAFSPSTLAHGSLATLDMWAAGGLAAVLFLLLRAERRSSISTFLPLGVALGLATGSKLTALPFAGIAVLYAWFAARKNGLSPSRSLLLVALAVLVAALVIWMSFGFGVGMVDLASLCGTGRGLGEGRFGPLPASLWIEGWLLQVRRGQVGFLNYLLGERSRTGWPWFYLVVLAVKVTVGAQILAVLGFIARLRWGAGLKWPAEALLLLYPFFLVLAMSLGNTQAGVRYILPSFPFFLVWLAIQSRRAFEKMPRIKTAVCGLVALACFENLRIHPHHLMFFNLFAGGPEGGPRYLITSEDWGQDQRRLAVWQKENGVKRLYYSRYNGNPEAWGITYRQAPCVPLLAGKYALHAIEVHRPKRVRPGCFDWLTQEEPDERIGYSIYVYRVDDARLERLKGGVEGPAFWSAPGLPPYRDRGKSTESSDDREK